MMKTIGGEAVEVWYRYEDVRYAAAVDEYGYTRGPGRTEVRLLELQVSKVTPKGVWLALGGWGTPRFVLREARKQYASPTIDAALTAFIARKRRQCRILRAQLANAEEALQIGEAMRPGAELTNDMAFIGASVPPCPTGAHRG